MARIMGTSMVGTPKPIRTSPCLLRRKRTRQSPSSAGPLFQSPIEWETGSVLGSGSVSAGRKHYGVNPHASFIRSVLGYRRLAVVQMHLRIEGFENL